MRHNPAFLTDEELLRGFYVHRGPLESLLGSVRRSTGSANEHVLLFGSRGTGKSTLLRAVSARVRRDPEMRKAWLCLFYPEESYEVGSAGEFWLEALLRLGDATGDPQWQKEWATARALRDDVHLEAHAMATLRRFHAVDGRKLLLFVENFDMLIEQIPDRDASALRKVLQAEPWILLVASAVRRFAGVDAPDRPMYELFRRFSLDPLTAEEIAEAWLALTGVDIGVERAQAVRILTGGNLRVIVILAGLGRSCDLSEILSHFAELIDRYTDAFKDNIEALKGQNRRMFLAAATLWRPSTVREIAEEARLDPRLGSVVLGRLIDQGRIEIVGKLGKNQLYQVSERFCNLYYLMRRHGGSDANVRALVHFVIHHYEPEASSAVRTRLADRDLSTEEAVTVWLPLLRDPSEVMPNVSAAISRLVHLAVSGAERATLDGLRGGPTEGMLRPALTALAILLDEEVRVPAEEREVAQDIVAQVRRLRASEGAPVRSKCIDRIL